MITNVEGNTAGRIRPASTLEDSNVQKADSYAFHPSPGPIGRVYQDSRGQFYLYTQTSGHLKIEPRVGKPLALRQGAADRLVSRLQARLRPYQYATALLSAVTAILSVLLIV